MSEIVSINACEIIDSRGLPTVRTQVRTSRGAVAEGCVPSGASTGSREALELRDNDRQRYRGKGVLQAVRHVNEEIAPMLCGLEVQDQENLDRIMCKLDGSKNKGNYGANAILSVSLAVSRVAAVENAEPLYRHLAADGAKPLVMPMPMMNVINGGAHANNDLDVQEFMVLPVGAGSMREAVRYGVEIYYALRSELAGRGVSTAVGDEGGFAPPVGGAVEALDLLMKATEKAGFKPGGDVLFGLDMASTELYKDGQYKIDGKTTDAAGVTDMLLQWIRQYPIMSVEDALAEDDWEGWKELTARLGSHVQLVGDDLFVTDAATLQQGIDQKVANAILIKLNQIGSLSETIATINVAAESGYAAVVSHRSGETEDSFIADLAVATGVGQIKTGAPCRSDRTAKYNRLMIIEDELGGDAEWPGNEAFSRYTKP